MSAKMRGFSPKPPEIISSEILAREMTPCRGSVELSILRDTMDVNVQLQVDTEVAEMREVMEKEYAERMEKKHDQMVAEHKALKTTIGRLEEERRNWQGERERWHNRVEDAEMARLALLERFMAEMDRMREAIRTLNEQIMRTW